MGSPNTATLSRLRQHWVADDPYATHFIDAMHIIFPPGERGFCRILNDAERFIAEPALKQRVQSFVRQEGQHARAHAVAFANLDEGGVWTRRATRFTLAVLAVMLPRRAARNHYTRAWRVATVAAVEHLTAEMGRWMFEESRLDVESRDSAMTELLRWHCAEEVEHRSVAFDTLVALEPRYQWLLRSLAMTLWIPALFVVWFVCASALLADDPSARGRIVTPRRLRPSEERDSTPHLLPFSKRMFSFYRRSYHPNSIVPAGVEARVNEYLEALLQKDERGEHKRNRKHVEQQQQEQLTSRDERLTLHSEHS